MNEGRAKGSTAFDGTQNGANFSTVDHVQSQTLGRCCGTPRHARPAPQKDLPYEVSDPMPDYDDLCTSHGRDEIKADLLKAAFQSE
jgi:hypothetical protein